MLVPYKLEVVWCLVRPRDVNEATQFYSAPNYRTNSKLTQHIISQMHIFLLKYPNAGFVCGGDKNKMPIQAIVDALPKCKQIVTRCTYKKIHDMILSNMSQLFAIPFITPAVQPDGLGQGVSQYKY